MANLTKQEKFLMRELEKLLTIYVVDARDFKAIYNGFKSVLQKNLDKLFESYIDEIYSDDQFLTEYTENKDPDAYYKKYLR